MANLENIFLYIELTMYQLNNSLSGPFCPYILAKITIMQ